MGPSPTPNRLKSDADIEFNRDGSLVAITGSTLRATGLPGWEVPAGTPVPLAPLPAGGNASALAFAQDDQVAFTLSSYTIQQFKLRSARKAGPMIKLDELPCAIAYSPDGSLLACLTFRGKERILYVFDSITGELLLSQTATGGEWLTWVKIWFDKSGSRVIANRRDWIYALKMPRYPGSQGELRALMFLGTNLLINSEGNVELLEDSSSINDRPEVYAAAWRTWKQSTER
jgi:hypothetical protein